MCDNCVECNAELNDSNRDDFSDVCWDCQDKPSMPKMPNWQEISDELGKA